MFHSTPLRPQPHRYIYVGTPENLKQRHDAAPEREFSCSVGFSGQGSIGVLRRKGERRVERVASVERLYQPEWVEYQYFDADGSERTARISLSETLPPSYLVSRFNPSQRLEWMSNFKTRHSYRRSLESTDSDVRRKRKAKGLTTRGKRCVADGAELLTYRFGRKRLGFYTLTCPFDSPDEIRVFNDAFPEIIRRFMQEHKRQYEKKGGTFSYIGVYEIQARRFHRSGKPCLHFHYVSPATDSKGRFIWDVSDLRNCYAKIIEQVTGIRPVCRPRVGAELVRASAAKYLAKYYSKGGLPHGSPDADDMFGGLSSWYSISRNLLRAVHRARFELAGNFSSAVYRASQEGGNVPGVRYIRAVYAVIGAQKVQVGVVFELEAERLRILQRLKFPEVAHLL